MIDKLKIEYFVRLSMVLFILSLVLGFDSVKGWHAFVYGFLGMFKASGICFLWLANPALAISWVTVKMRGVSFRFSLIAVVLSISFFILEELFHITKIKSYGLGYFFWVLSSVVMLLGTLLVKKNAVDLEQITPTRY